MGIHSENMVRTLEIKVVNLNGKKSEVHDTKLGKLCSFST